MLDYSCARDRQYLKSLRDEETAVADSVDMLLLGIRED